MSKGIGKAVSAVTPKPLQKIAGKVDPASGYFMDKARAGGGGMDKGAAGDLAPKEDRSKEFETREAMLLAQAQAGGAQRTPNEADLLGYTGGVRKRAARTLLG